MATIRCILAIAAISKWKVHQLDINNAFRHSDLHEEVYIRVPEGLAHKPNQVCLFKEIPI